MFALNRIGLIVHRSKPAYYKSVQINFKTPSNYVQLYLFTFHVVHLGKRSAYFSNLTEGTGVVVSLL